MAMAMISHESQDNDGLEPGSLNPHELPTFEVASKKYIFGGDQEKHRGDDLEWVSRCGADNTEPGRQALCDLVEKALQVTNVFIQLLRGDKNPHFPGILPQLC